MYAIKGKQDDNNVNYIYEHAADVLEAEKAALDMGVYEIHAAHLTKIREVYRDDNNIGIWWSGRVTGLYADEETGKAKKGRYIILIQSPDFISAANKLYEILRQYPDFEANGITATNITDVISV